MRMPSPPVSRKPAVMMMAPLTPFWPHSSRTPATSFAGTTMTARSMVPGTAQHRGIARQPLDLRGLGVDRVHRTLEAVLQDVGQHPVTQLPLLSRGANHCHGLGSNSMSSMMSFCLQT